MSNKGRLAESSRREFFARIGGTAAALTAATSVWDSPFGAATVAAAGSGDSPAFRRANAAFRVRQQAALDQRLQPPAVNTANGDEALYAARLGSFSKALPHNAFGEVDSAAFSALVAAMASGDAGDFAAIPLGGPGRLVNPQAALAFAMIGADSHHLAIRTPPRFASAEEAGEMVEVYWQALTRDVPFASYATDPGIATAAAELTAMADFRGPKSGGAVTPATLFRGPTAGDRTGPYISQFLWKPVPMGPYTLDQRVRVATPGVEYLTAFSEWLNVQNGFPPSAPKSYVGSSRRYISTGRDLAEYVHRDFTYQAFQNAALILLGGGVPLAAGNPYHTVGNQAPFATFGGPQILDCVAYAAVLGLHATWYQKWSVHRRLRPEAFGGRLEAKHVFGRPYTVHGDVLGSVALAQVIASTGTRLLPMAYPEGSPAHPAYPAGHAAIAGACTTMLKAFLDESAPMPAPVEPDLAGGALLPYSGPPLTVGGELDKLASNISIGRDTAGVHWRTDGEEGMRLGEQVAIAALRDLKRCYNESFVGFQFTSFDGEPIAI